LKLLLALTALGLNHVQSLWPYAKGNKGRVILELQPPHISLIDFCKSRCVCAPIHAVQFAPECKHSQEIHDRYIDYPTDISSPYQG
jgi:hypothetical protein